MFLSTGTYKYMVSRCAWVCALPEIWVATGSAGYVLHCAGLHGIVRRPIETHHEWWAS